MLVVVGECISEAENNREKKKKTCMQNVDFVFSKQEKVFLASYSVLA